MDGMIHCNAPANKTNQPASTPHAPALQYGSQPGCQTNLLDNAYCWIDFIYPVFLSENFTHVPLQGAAGNNVLIK